MKVIAAMSGGVDSAVAAARAVDEGHDVTGIHLALSRNPKSYRTGARGCCTIEDSNDARRAADQIGIPFYVWDLSDRFHQDVVEDFKSEYLAGRTPNPCLRCNEKIKFEAVLDRAVALGYDAVATGHYATLVTADDGTIEMHRAVDSAKDQSYVLDIEPVSGTVTVGPRHALTVDRIEGIKPRWCGVAPATVDGTVQLRAHGDEHRARVVVEGDAVAIALRDPAQGIAPGQAAVIYDGTRVVGSCTIAATARS